MKVENICYCWLITKINLSTKIAEIENRIAAVVDLIKKTGFGEKPNDISNRVTSNEKRQTETGKKVNDHIASYTKFINKLKREILIVSTKYNSSLSCSLSFKDWEMDIIWFFNHVKFYSNGHIF